MTVTEMLYREDTGTMATVKIVDPLGIGDVELDPDLPLGFADAIEGWLCEEHGYDYADVVAKSAGARAEGRKRLEMLDILEPIDFAPKIQLQIFADTSAFDTEMERVISEMPELPEGVAVVEKPGWVPPPEMITEHTPGDGIPILAAAVRGEREPSIFDGPAPDEAMPGVEARRRGPRGRYTRAADGWLERLEAWLRARFTPVKEEK